MSKKHLKKVYLNQIEQRQYQSGDSHPLIFDGDAPGTQFKFIDEFPTLILPISGVDYVAISDRDTEKIAARADGQVAVLGKLIKSAGIYALSSVMLPLISLVLSPFLTHNLSLSDYGILTILNTAVGLVAGITQLGLASAFFRTYNYDYTSEHDKRDVIAVTTTLLCLISLLSVITGIVMAPVLARTLLGRVSLSPFIDLAIGVVFIQNLTVPGLAWLRAENRPFFYSLLSISGLLITVIATIVLVGILHWGVTGAIIANGCGYASIMFFTMPIILLRVGLKIRLDVARNLLSFGLPLVFNFVSYWVLQFSDRYLLSLHTSLAETAKYTVGYTLGSAISALVMGPFTLAWPTTMFAIARRKDAIEVFMLVFRWFGLFLLLAAFTLTLVGLFLLKELFPVAYYSAASIIPVVAESLVFYGIYYVFMVGPNVKRKTWLAAVFTTTAAIINFIANLILIPDYGGMGAAVSTLIAYIVLALAAYIISQRLYPVPYEIGRFATALSLGVVLYFGSSFVARFLGTSVAWSIYAGTLILYSVCLVIIGKLPLRNLSMICIYSIYKSILS